MRAKNILLLLSLFCICKKGFAQAYYNATALVGDTVFATRIYHADDSYCGKVSGSASGPSNEGFTFKNMSFASPVSADIYFTPLSSGPDSIYIWVSLFYEAKNKGCVANKSYSTTIYGLALPDTSSLFLPKVYTLDLYPDIVERQYTDTINLVYRNKNPDNISIKNITYKGDDSDKVTLTYSNGSPINSKRDVVPFSKSDTIRILYSSKDGPYLFDTVKNAFLIVTKERKGVISYDTLYLNINIHLISLSNVVTVHPGYGLYLGFECAFGDTTYSAATITYTDMVKKFKYEPIVDNSGFSIYNVVKEPNKESVIFRFIPQSEEDRTLEYYFSYFIERFDGSLQEIIRDVPADAILLVGHVIPKTFVDSKPYKEKLLIYPNPTNDILWIETSNIKDNIRVSVYDLLGNCLLSGAKEFTDNSKLSINVSSLNNGIYYVRVLQDNTASTTKLLINR